MARYNKDGNVYKICRCGSPDWKTCEHSYYLTFQRNGRRYRRNLEMMTGQRVDSLEAAQEAARKVIAGLAFPKKVVRSTDGVRVITQIVPVKIKKALLELVMSTGQKKYRRTASAIFKEALVFGLAKRFGIKL